MSENGIWRGDDGQLYNSWHERDAANNRYRQQQEQNRLLAEQNRLINEQNRFMEQQAKAELERKERELEQEEIKSFSNLFSDFSVEVIADSERNEKVVKRRIRNINEILKSDIDTICNYKNEINTASVEEIDARTKSWIEFNEEYLSKKEAVYKEKLEIFKNINEAKEEDGVDFFNDLFEQAYEDIIAYEKEKTEELNTLKHKQIEEKIQKEREEKLKSKKEIILNIYNNKKSYYSTYKAVNIVLAVCTLICLMSIPVALVVIIGWICFARALKPEKRYLKDVNKIGFNSIEEFEKIAKDIKENKNVDEILEKMIKEK